MDVESVERAEEQLDLTPSPRLLEVLGDLPYKPWQCLAELIDNAFDDFLTDPDPEPQNRPTVRVTLPKASTSDEYAEVCVSDTGRGMTLERLQNALRAGYSSNTRYGHLGLFGMGFNIATARLGHVTEVRTTRAGDTDWLVAEINFQEMRSRDSFRVPLRREKKDDPLTHGTEIVVRRLKPEIRDSIKRPNTAYSVREKLGSVYSYLLRSEDPVPALPDSDLAGRGFQLYVNEKRVKPRLPCVWSAERSVDYRGNKISAIQTIARELPPAVACMACGHWHKIETDQCVECGSSELELRPRQVRGWLGIQRYLDATDYGIDFLRNGRKILMGDKSLFTWENLDTGESFMEYPIELPANQGRIVGEIHLDHAPVFYQKNDFDRSSRDWNDAVIMIRGEAPLQPEKARKRLYPENNTALALLFKGFRRNDPGLKCLIPGDGSKPLHQRARDWADKFRKDLPEYWDDSVWYQAVLEHEAIKNGPPIPPPAPKGPDGKGGLGRRTGLDDDSNDDKSKPPSADGPGNDSNSGPKPEPKPRVETEEKRYKRYRESARILSGLRGDITVPNVGKRSITVFETREPLAAADGRTVPCLVRSVQGNATEVYVNGNHEIFREYGREPRDYAVIELAEHLRTVSSSKEKITVLAAEITRQFSDQRITDSALRERAESLLDRIRGLLAPLAGQHAEDLWARLPQQGKLFAEREAARTEPKLDWRAATETGEFAAYLDASSIGALVRARPDLVLDGHVFATTWSNWSDEATKARQVGRVARLLDTIGEFLTNNGAKGRLELASTRLTLDMLDDELAQSE
ncbi:MULTISPECIES: ATP-binding protein [unclassified Streptomyces]|uniref:ATP-binding protein n=1 Tax=unclassified Streptomyces TaxID=2593676 RepID=UPI001F296A5C|nr:MULTISPECIES: ATP-binding protein [unclassified Streptomyces]